MGTEARKDPISAAQMAARRVEAQRLRSMKTRSPAEIGKIRAASNPQEEQCTWQCVREGCRVYIDAEFEIDGIQYIIAEQRIRCPRCGSRKLATVEDNYFLAEHDIVEPEIIPASDPELLDCIKEAGAVQDEIGLYPTDSGVDNEPIWPRMVTQVIIGASLYLGQKMSELTEAIRRGPLRGGG